MSTDKSKTLSNLEIVTVAVYLLGGESRSVDTEDIAVKANGLAAGRFKWHKYQDQINIEKVRTSLSDAKKTENGHYLSGSGNAGWQLTPAGLKLAKNKVRSLKDLDLSRNPLSEKQKKWVRVEKERILASEAYTKFKAGKVKDITQQEAGAFFRIDDYVSEKAREQKIIRAKNMFSEDKELGKIIAVIESILRRERNGIAK